MDFRLISRYLASIAFIVGLSMSFSLVWALPGLGGIWEVEAPGVYGLLLSIFICLLVSSLFHYFGRNVTDLPLRKEALAVVGLGWILAMCLGTLPYLFSGACIAPDRAMTFADALFETQSGLSTTGATVFSNLEDPHLLPRTILFWRCSTTFLGGLGFMLFFVALLGHGSSDKTIMRFERSPLGEANSATHIRQVASALLRVYLGLNIALIIILRLEGISFYDAICHSFATIATGGFSTYNNSIGYFVTQTNLNAALIEYTIIIFMILGATNLMLLYWFVIGKRSYLLHDIEWRTFITIIIVATLLIFGLGLWNQELNLFDVSAASSIDGMDGLDSKPETPWWVSFRIALFQVVSLMTTTGFCISNFEQWCSASLFIIIIIEIMGGCSGSTSGGTKIIRWLIGAKALHSELEHSYRPSVVRSLKLGGFVLDKEVVSSVMTFFVFYCFMIGLTVFIILLIEPNTLWTSETGVNFQQKLTDIFSATLASYSTVGPGLGVIGSQGNYGALTSFTKIILSIAMLLGRLELYIILVLFTPSFWSKN